MRHARYRPGFWFWSVIVLVQVASLSVHLYYRGKHAGRCEMLDEVLIALPAQYGELYRKFCS